MDRRKFTPEQLAELRSNVHVAKCGDSEITYTPKFKIWAVHQYEKEGLTAKQIFEAAGFKSAIMGRDRPKNCLIDWRRIYAKHGEQGLRAERRGYNGRGGRPNTKGLTDTDKIKRLEAEVAYLKAENHFLTKLRAQRAE